MAIGYTRPTQAIINKEALRHNVREAIKGLPRTTELFAVVKANGYGHGAVEVAKAAREAGATGFCVAILDEALELRAAGLTEPILILEIVSPEYVPILIKENLSITVASSEWLTKAQAIFQAEGCSERLKIHLKIDTGMGRIGFTDTTTLTQALEYLAEYSQTFYLEGIYTHFATADAEDDTYYQRQMQRFRAAVSLCPSTIRYVHVANSAAALWHECPECNLVRFGISLYGFNPSGRAIASPYPLKEALQLTSQLVQVKLVAPGESIGYGATYQVGETAEWIGTVPIGYADGFVRRFSGFELLVGGQRCPIVGRVCMDQCMIRLPNEMPVGSTVTIFGTDGEATNTIQSAADYIGTITHEVCCLLTERVPRVYR